MREKKEKKTLQSDGYQVLYTNQLCLLYSSKH